MNCHDDAPALRCRDDAFLGVRGKPGVPDDVVERCMGACMQQLRHGCDEPVVSGTVERPAQGRGYVRLEENPCLRADIGIGTQRRRRQGDAGAGDSQCACKTSASDAATGIHGLESPFLTGLRPSPARKQ